MRRAGVSFVALAAFAAVAIAAETAVQCVPSGDSYVATAVLVPGCGGAEVCGGKDQGHVDFRIGFGVDQHLSVNGDCAGPYCPQGAYRVTVTCERISGQWFATTQVVSLTTGALVFSQLNYPMPAGAEDVRVVAQDVVQLSVQ
jgi:hypothetical protein